MSGSPRRQHWSEEGKEPDYRFTLANERTFLAWLRTALALLAGAIALDQFVPPFRITGVLTALAVVLAVTGTVLAAFAYRRWARVQRAMRHDRPLPRTWLPLVVGWAAALAGAVVLILVLANPK